MSKLLIERSLLDDFGINGLLARCATSPLKQRQCSASGAARYGNQYLPCAMPYNTIIRIPPSMRMGFMIRSLSREDEGRLQGSANAG